MGDDQTITLTGRPEAPRTAHDVGVRIGRYVLVDRIGAGGMGVVWEAHDPELGRRVAIKVVRSVSAREPQERLLREAQAMARLSHPAVVPVFDVGTHGDEVFVAMELVDGETLKSALAARRRPWREVLTMFTQAGRGLVAAHRAGIVHRDFKPANVLVGRDGRVRVTDFGLARLGSTDGEPPLPGERGAASPPGLTRSGAAMGTPRYMAPEQHRGEPTSAATDQFGFCVALWEALYGASPFVAGVTEEPRALSELAEAVTSGRIVPPPAGSPVPARIQRILARGLAVAPVDRWPSMAALIDALEDVPRRRRRIVLGIAAGLGGAAVIGAFVLALALRGAGEPGPAPCRSLDRRLANIWDPEVRARGARGFAGTDLPFAVSTWTLAAARLDAYAARWIDHARATCEATFVSREQAEADHALREQCLAGRLHALRALAATFAQPDRTSVERSVDAAAALPDLAICDDVVALRARPLAPANAEQQDRAEALGAELARLEADANLGAFERAHGAAIRTTDAARALGYPPHHATALFYAGRLENELGRGEPAARLEEASILAEASRDDPLRFQILDQLARSHIRASRFEPARWSIRQARGVIARIGFHPRFEAAIRMREAELVWAETAIARAVELREEALAWAQRTEPLDELLVGRIRLTLSSSYQRVRRFDEAASQLALGRAVLERMLGAAHPLLGQIHSSEGNLAFGQEQYERAAASYERALAHYERALGPDSARALHPLYNLGLAYLELDRPDDAARVLDAGLAVVTRRHGVDHPDATRWALSRGDADLMRGDFARARTTAERALEQLGRPGTPPLEVHRARYLLGQALWKEGRERGRARAILLEVRAAHVAAGEGHEQNVEAIDTWLKKHGVR